MILIGLLKFYNAEEAKTDPELINKITLGIKYITNPKQFLNKKISWLEKETTNKVVSENKKALVIKPKKPLEVAQNAEAHLAKQPDDLIVIRQLKGKTVLNDIDLADEEVNDFLLGQTKSKTEDFTTRLKKIV